jgi:hypothetical protein
VLRFSYPSSPRITLFPSGARHAGTGAATGFNSNLNSFARRFNCLSSRPRACSVYSASLRFTYPLPMPAARGGRAAGR